MSTNSITKIPFLLLLVMVLGVSTIVAKTITSTPQGGKWGEITTWIGGETPTKDDDVIITSLVITNGGPYSATTYLTKNLTVNKGGTILREGAGSGGYVILEVGGNLINNGEIIDLAAYFDVKLNGSLENNGILKPRTIYLNGSDIFLSTSKPIESSNFTINNTVASITANSDLWFKNSRVSKSGDGYINLKNYNLTLEADTIAYSGYVTSKTNFSVPIIFETPGIINIDKSIFGAEITGDATIESKDYAFLNAFTINGNLYINENTKVSTAERLKKIRVNGNFFNNGIMNYDTIRTAGVVFAAKNMTVSVYGDFSNTSITGATDIVIVTEGSTRKIKGIVDNNFKILQSETTATPGGKALIEDKFIIGGRLELYADLEIDTTGYLELTGIDVSQFYIAKDIKLINNGVLDRVHDVKNSWLNRNFTNQIGTSVDYELRSWKGTLNDGIINSINVKTVNNQAYPGLSGTAKRWWRIQTPDKYIDLQYTIKFFYDETQLNGQKEEDLNVFRTTDGGATWKVVSVGEFAEHNMEENYFSIGSLSKLESMLTEFGDFVIGTGNVSVPLEIPIEINLIGRSDVRLGAPNPFTVTIDNLTNKPTESYILAIDVDDEIVFDYFEFYSNDGMVKVPFDSMGLKADDTALLFVPSLNPNETVKFDFVVHGVAPGTKGTLSAGKSIKLGAFGKGLAKDKIEEVIVDYVNSKIQLDDKELAEYARGLGLTVQQVKLMKEKEGVGVFTFKSILKTGAEKVSNSNPVSKVLFKIGSAIETVSKIAPSLRQRLFHWFYKETGLYGVEETKVVAGKGKAVKMVKSWDPNEKSGPSGYGEDNYLRRAGTFQYNISFENKKEATAAAYKIEIVDTLSSVFDWESVKFGNTSHNGDEYNWTMERKGNILRWYIEGIELLPNVTPPQGEGFVSFSVKLKDNVNSGEIIKNNATIVFDENPAITTNTWVNIIDTIAPVTNSLTANYIETNAAIALTVDAADNSNGSGVGELSYYVSIDGTPFQLIGSGFDTEISYEANLDKGKVYRFYAVSTDNVGNQENKVPQITEVDITAPSSVEYTNFDYDVNIYPNPVQSLLNIEFNSEDAKTVSYQLTDMSGKVMIEGNFAPGIGLSNYNLNISDLTAGVYILRLNQDRKQGIYKIIKQ
jgi:hypothetical protein